MTPRTLFFVGEIAEESTKKFLEELIDLEADDDKAPILLMLSSEGGSVRHAMTLYDTITSSSCPVYGLVSGECLSAAGIILQACKKRYMLPHASFMMHRGTASSGTVPQQEFRCAARSVEAEEKLFNSLLSKRSSLSKRAFNRLSSSGRYLTAEETVAAGLADAVIERRNLRLLK